jgi:nitric oxide reductase activation protein
LQRHRGQAEGEVLDLDPMVDLAVTAARGESGDERIYQTRLKTAHDLGVLVLLDASGSTGEHQGAGRRTFDEQRQLTAKLAIALEEIGDRVAVFGFSSQGRQSVQLQRVKEFDERWDHRVARRLESIEPSGYTRLGAAIRHGIHLVTEKSGATNKLLTVISDGFPYDDGYEGVYAERDTRQALVESRLQGVGAVCMTIATSTKEADLGRVFGTAAHLRLADVSDLNKHVEEVFGSAMRFAARAQRTGQHRKDR